MNNFSKPVFVVLFGISLLTSCHKKNDTVVPVNTITVIVGETPPNNGGTNGTYISLDSLYSVTTTSANCRTSILRIGSSHNILGYGHVWSKDYATPTLENSDHTDYGVITTPVTFISYVKELTGDSKYYLRTWIAIEDKNTSYRQVVYSKEILEFKTN